MRCHLIFGGARSGKSAYAEKLAAKLSADGGRQVIYIATAAAGDSEMQSRIAHHRQRRPAGWITLEQPLELGTAIRRYSSPRHILLIDCLTLWLSNCVLSNATEFPDIGSINSPPLFLEQRAALLSALSAAAGEVILVSNEVGMGIVPMGALSRWFVDEAGRLNQALAAECEQVVWVAAGLPLLLKGQPC